MSSYWFTTTDTIFNRTFEEKRDHSRHSTKVHQLLLTFVCWFKRLTKSLQRGGYLRRVRRRLRHSEVETHLRVEVVLRAGAHDARVVEGCGYRDGARGAGVDMAKSVRQCL